MPKIEGVDLLPLTSVMATERIILGSSTEFVKQTPSGYIFMYDVQFNNAGVDEIEVIGYRWVVVGADGHRTIAAEGEGIGGFGGTRPRSLPAGDAARVQGQIRSHTSMANAEGTYRIRIRAADGAVREIEAWTDFVGLASSPGMTHVPNYVATQTFR